MKWIVGDCGNRQGNFLCDLPGEEVFRVLDGSLYGPDEVIASAVFLETPARFDIRPPVEFDILNYLFGEVDAFCGDPTLRDENDIDEDQLREAAKMSLAKLQQLPITDM